MKKAGPFNQDPNLIFYLNRFFILWKNWLDLM